MHLPQHGHERRDERLSRQYAPNPHPLLGQLKYTKEAELLAEFGRHFVEAIDRNILELAVQNTDCRARGDHRLRRRHPRSANGLGQ